MVLAEFGKYPLQTHFWQQVRFHNRAVKMPNSRLMKLAMVDGVWLQNNHVLGLQERCWRLHVSSSLEKVALKAGACRLHRLCLNVWLFVKLL